MRCEYLHALRETGLSDHSAIEVDFAPECTKQAKAATECITQTTINPPSSAPPEPDDPAPIATAEQFRDALLQVRDREGITPKDLGILRAFCRAPDHALTAPKLAQAADLASWQEANLRFGTLARSIGEALHFTPSTRPDGTLRWWQSLAHGAADYEDETGHFPWTLRPELVRALQTMKWV